jgi:hypothetical protein
VNSRKIGNRFRFRITWCGKEKKKEESKVLDKPGVAVQAYNSSYSGC